MTETQANFISLLRFAVCRAPLPEGFRVADAEALYRLAKTHDLAHLVGYALRENGLLEPDAAGDARYDREEMLALWRVNVLEGALREVRDALEAAGIDFLPLKGAVLRALYPEPWMRTSADIDVLVRREDFLRAEQTLLDRLGGKRGYAGRHDHHIDLPSGFHVELHFALSEQQDAASELLHAVWDTAVPVREGAREHRMPDEMQYLYHVYHAASHLRRMSFGVRAALDTWLLCHRVAYDPAARRVLLEQGGLARFSDALEALAEAWFSGATLDKRYLDAEALFFTGGVYTGRHSLAAAQAKAGGGLGYVLARAFPPRSTLREGYPVLERKPWLLPACWAHRLGKAALRGKAAAAQKELRALNETRGLSRELAEIFADIGLQD